MYLKCEVQYIKVSIFNLLDSWDFVVNEHLVHFCNSCSSPAFPLNLPHLLKCLELSLLRH